MTKNQRTSLLWFLAGVLFLIAGLMSEPTRLLAIVTGVLFLAVGIRSLQR